MSKIRTRQACCGRISDCALIKHGITVGYCTLLGSQFAAFFVDAFVFMSPLAPYLYWANKVLFRCERGHKSTSLGNTMAV